MIIANQRTDILSMRIDKIGFGLLVILLLLMECSFFMLNAMPNFLLKYCGYNVKYGTCLLASIGCFFALLGGYSYNVKRKYLFWLPIVLFSLLAFLAAIVSTAAYSQSFVSTIKVAIAAIAVPLLYFALHAIVEDENDYTFFVNTTITISTIYALLCLAQSLLYSRGIVFMDANYQLFGSRYDSLRLIMSGDFVAFGFVLSFGKAINKDCTGSTRFVYLICSAICAIELLYVAQTRVVLMGILAVVLIGFAFSGRSRKIRIFIIIAAMVIIATQFSNQIMNILLPENLSFSADARQGAYAYYISRFADNGLLGIGFIPSDSIAHDSIVMVRDTLAARGDITDIGIIGYIGRYGILGIGVMAIGAYILIKAIRKGLSISLSQRSHTEAWLLLVYLIAICPTMAITDAQRIFYLPIVLLLVESALYEAGRREKNDDEVEAVHESKMPIRSALKTI